MNLPDAQKLANRIVELLSPYSHKIHIAGSIRREKKDVKDIEIVVQPFLQDTGLFHDYYTVVNRGFIEAASIFIESIELGDINGRHCKVKLKKTDILCDIFLPKPEDYFRQLAIRTGDRNFVTTFIAGRWVEMGYCGTGETGLRKMEDCEGTRDAGGKMNWKIINHNGENPAGWESEEQFFEWLGYHWCHPRFRDMEKYGKDFILRKLKPEADEKTIAHHDPE